MKPQPIPDISEVLHSLKWCTTQPEQSVSISPEGCKVLLSYIDDLSKPKTSPERVGRVGRVGRRRTKRKN